ncbi:unnamed protein product [Rotaria sordida]|uniref:Integrase catalytic domain-containing protein n=1 Tax=Rotaria sordida TaxID=392033 RepID=A0A819UQ37_9BILA|nr:unnamed protein product [Rotaria sordida]CAF1106392.1 unnamed protein product [Rotaria sordida]CAF1314583.1 unnamed protein product [Rotaria sordida]CAF4099539.1 unnamed protein product [Rotaria sordida]
MGKFMGSYFLIVVDAHSKWLEPFIMNDISTTTTTTINTLTSLFARYGFCEEIVSDNRTQFTSEEFAGFCTRNGIRHIRTTSGHPQSNGQAERYVDIVKSALKKGLHNGGKISDVLSKFLFCCKSTSHATTNQIKHRLWSSDEDLIAMNPTTITSDHDKYPSALPSSDQGSKII